MKILGTGIDIIDIKRFKKSITNKNFLLRLFTTLEIKKAKHIENKTVYYSKKFAAKESFSKALGTGFSKGLNFRDIEVLNDKLGKPYFKLNIKLKKLLLKNFKIKNFNILLSISDERDYSVAFTIIQDGNVQ